MLLEWESFQHFHFLRPQFALLLIPWVALLLFQRRQKNATDMFGGIIAPHLLEHLRVQRIRTSWFNPRSVTTVFSLLALVVLMGPSWRQQPSPLHEDEAALIILLDLSSSMEQRDVQPSRLQRAKQKVSDLLALRPDKKAALIVYAGTAHTVLSLTADSDILQQYLSATTPQTMPRPGKFPEYGLPLVDEILSQNTAPATLVLYTDGLGADSALAFSTYFSQRNHQLLVAGVGTQNVEEGGVPIELQQLRNLANKSNGKFIPLTTDDKDVRQINRRIDNHYVVLNDETLPWLDSGYFLIFPAMALFLLWFRSGWTLTWSFTWSALLLSLLLVGQPNPAIAQSSEPPLEEDSNNLLIRATGSFANFWLTSDQQGRLLLQFGEYELAASRFQDPVWKGLAHYYAEDFMRAAEYFSRSDTTLALFNEANARAHARDYLRALHRYDRLLEKDPAYPGAKRNRLRVAELVDEINRLSESQQQEAGVSSEEKSLSGEDAIPAEGADEINYQKQAVAQLSAQDILRDPQLEQMWLRGVQHDPSNFLAIKFSMQLLARPKTEGSKP